MIRFKNTNFLDEFSFLVWKHFECCCLTMDQVAYWWLDHWPIRAQHSFTWSTINQSEPGMLMILMMTEKVCWIILSQKLSSCWYNPRLGKTFDQHITITGCESELNDLCLKRKSTKLKDVLCRQISLKHFLCSQEFNSFKWPVSASLAQTKYSIRHTPPVQMVNI